MSLDVELVIWGLMGLFSLLFLSNLAPIQHSSNKLSFFFPLAKICFYDLQLRNPDYPQISNDSI